MLPEFRYFSKYFRVKIGNIAKLLFTNNLFDLKFKLTLYIIEMNHQTNI